MKNEVSKIPKIIAKKMIKIVTTILVIAAVIILLDILGLISFYFFSKHNLKDFAKIPGLDDGYIPQGMCYIDQYTGVGHDLPFPFGPYLFGKNLVLITAYCENKPSKLYVMDYPYGKIIKDFFIKAPNGEYIYNHVGGLTIDGEYIWICGNNKLYNYNFRIITEINEPFITCDNEFDIPISR